MKGAIVCAYPDVLGVEIRDVNSEVQDPLESEEGGQEADPMLILPHPRSAAAGSLHMHKIRSVDKC